MNRQDTNYQISAFVDDNPKLRGGLLRGKSILSFSELEKLHANNPLDFVLLALPELNQEQRKKILQQIRLLKVGVRVLPTADELMRGTTDVSQLQEVDIIDLLGRNEIIPDETLLHQDIKGQNILVTGAGGSIGSELSRQIITLKPKKIILLEQSEFFLYQIDQELSDFKIKENSDIAINSYLGSVADDKFISHIFSKEKIDTVYHAAAHKHVPLVEFNPLPAIETNIFGTNILATHSYKNNVDNFVLISSDKAVRPTNIMGATKRFAELILQALQEKVNELPANQCRTKFCMVRFGNVLDTSGSVVPLFRKQIANGGPITVTDPRVIRYFMTIQEATELVIQTGTLSKGGDVFLLEML